jgi:hypothetical protein
MLGYVTTGVRTEAPQMVAASVGLEAGGSGLLLAFCFTRLTRIGQRDGLSMIAL